MTLAMPYGWGKVPFGYEERLRWRILPFPEQEYEERIERLRRLMGRDGLDCLLVLGTAGDPANVRYLTNFDDLYGGETVVVVPLEGEVVLVTNAVMHGEPMHSGIPQVWPHEVRAAAAPRTVTGDAQVATVVDHVRDALAGLPHGASIGLAGDWRDQLVQALGIGDDGRTRRGIGLLTELRAIKSAREVGVLRKAARLADAAATAAMRAVAPGVTEFEIAAAANEPMFRGGAEHPAFPIAVVAGARAGLKHMPPSGYAIEDGDMVFIDLGARYMGYCSDCSRETVCGEPSAEQLRFMETQASIVEEVASRIGPGVVIGDVAAVAIEMAEEAGYGEYLYFRGHGVGTSLADAPALAPGNPVAFEAGMVFALEPMLVKYDFGTACWEDIWHVTADGVERLNESTPRFWEDRT
jgi:Xaa-Pro dipeptidase